MVRVLRGTRAGVERKGAVKSEASWASPRVCMHALRPARSDVRLVRAATALAHAGYRVSIVDVEHKATRHIAEGVAGHHTAHIALSAIDGAGSLKMKHVVMGARWARYYDCIHVVPWLLFKAVRMMRGIGAVLREPADVYHASDITALPACLLAARLRRKALIAELYELPLSQSWIVSRRLLNAASTLALRLMLPRCQGIIVTSPPFANEVRQRFGGSQPVVIRNISPYQPLVASERLRQRLGLAADTRIALYQGGLQPDRGLDAMVRAATHLDPATCIVLLGHGESQPELEELILKLGVSKQVKIAPAVPYAELQSWTASADIGIVTYRPGSLSVQLHLPNKVFEYLMAGLPVLTSHLEAVLELIRCYDVSQVVDSTEPAALGQAINAMLADRDGLARMRRNALAACQGELQWEAESSRLVELYREILALSVPRSYVETNCQAS